MDATFKMDQMVFNYRVAGVCIEDNHVLIHKQAKDHHWALPGGRVEVLEDSKSGIVREMAEELNIECKVDRLLWFTENFFEYKYRNFHEIGLFYLLSTVREHFQKGPFFSEEGDHLVYEWVHIDELHKINLYPMFLRTELQKLPTNMEHIIINQ
ncbi:NUDIX domain-containing protein [Filobacillus milosensis]|uniref:NUDIX domain-containing protein n=1 Tax=Filobacillus milosensis TaxID=94137 RepID=A0A4Y8IT17_9BACI|nr:NUDIX domain-containing protein [Filobacillus milosensis]TFB25004.1 NUDIX domain-containing protein [Filobacillus milosensis]